MLKYTNYQMQLFIFADLQVKSDICLKRFIHKINFTDILISHV